MFFLTSSSFCASILMNSHHHVPYPETSDCQFSTSTRQQLLHLLHHLTHSTGGARSVRLCRITSWSTTYSCESVMPFPGSQGMSHPRSRMAWLFFRQQTHFPKITSWCLTSSLVTMHLHWGPGWWSPFPNGTCRTSRESLTTGYHKLCAMWRMHSGFLQTSSSVC